MFRLLGLIVELRAVFPAAFRSMTDPQVAGYVHQPARSCGQLISVGLQGILGRR